MRGEDMKPSKRAIRILSLGILGLSLLSSIGVSLLWIRSQNQNDSIQWHGPNTMLMSISSKGLMCLWYANDNLGQYKGWRYVDFGKQDYLRTKMWPPPNNWGFRWQLQRTVKSPKGGWAVGGRMNLLVYFPDWLLLSVTLLPSLIWTLLLIRRRKKAGHCENCGYNLTGNISGICPECGERI